MRKALVIILCSAFSAGLVAETALSIWSLAGGNGIALSTAIELALAWLVVLAVFIASIVTGLRSPARWLVTVVHHYPAPHDDSDESDGSDESDDDESDDDDGSDGDDGSDDDSRQ